MARRRPFITANGLAIGQQYAGGPDYPEGYGMIPNSTARSANFSSVIGPNGSRAGVPSNNCGPCVTSACPPDSLQACGWAAIPFSTRVSQGSTNGVDTGPVLASAAAMRLVRVNSGRACYFQPNGIWMTARVATGNAETEGLLASVSINENQQLMISGAVGQAVGIPTTIFDDGFWKLPVDWGAFSAINNQQQQLVLGFLNPTAADIHIDGVIFGTPGPLQGY